MGVKKHIPNSITCMNLFSGCIASVCAFQGYFFYSLLFILLAAVFDFFDGMTARLLHVSSTIGKELDSLSDLVSFGLAPSIALYSLLSTTVSMISVDIDCIHYLAFLAFLIAVFSALRLAKFNVDERQTCSFIGLPTPANAIFFSSLIAISDPLMPVASYINRGWFVPILFNPYVMFLLVAIFSFLLVSEIPMFSLKFKNLQWQDNKLRYIFLILSVVLLLLFQIVALPFIILLYLLLSVSVYKK